MSRIKDVRGRQLFDSRGIPALEVEVETDDGLFTAMVPSGITSCPYDAFELRDKDPKVFRGQGVLKAVQNVNNQLAVAITGMDPTDQEGIDQALIDCDGSEDNRKSNLGANAILGVSMAVARAGAAKKGIPVYKHLNNLAGNPTMIMPVPSFNIINGGRHAGNGLAIQEFLIMPTGAESFAEAMKIGVEVYHVLKAIIRSQYGTAATAVGDEGGFAVDLHDNEDALKLVQKALKEAGYEEHVQIGIDVAASQIFNANSGQYNLNVRSTANGDSGEKLKSASELLRMYKLYAANYGVISIEDPFDRSDVTSYEAMTAELGELLQIAGDDLLSSNPERIELSIENSTCNALCLSLTKIGTVTEAIEANNLARNAGFGVIVSSRSGETEDSFISSLCVGLGTGQIKAGAPCRSERLAKYNELLRIEENLGDSAVYAGDYWRDPWNLETSSGAGGYA